MADWNGIRHITVVDRLRELAAEKPDALCCRMGDYTHTYSSMLARATEVAGNMSALGVGLASRVATLAPNRPELIELFFGLAVAGIIQVPLNPFLKGAFLHHQLADSAPEIVLTDEAGLRALLPVIDEVPTLRHVVLFDPIPAEVDDPRVIAFAELPQGSATLPDLTPASTMTLLYTSGTTGQPKGCVLSHGYYVRAGQIDAELARLTDEDVFLTCLPLFHAGSQLKVLMPALMGGVPFHVEPSFSASQFFQRVTETGATIASAVGTMAAMILAAPASDFDRGHRLRLFNAAPVSVSACAAFTERFGVDVWNEAFGQTECVPVLTGNPYGERDRTSAGRPVRDLEVALLDDDLQQVPLGEVGEICVRPRHRFALFDGYWNNPEATLSSFSGLWYHTGDYGRELPSGNVSFVDRKKDALRVRGENVSSLELETAIGTHPDIVEAAVHAIPSDVEEDDIKACVVVREGVRLDPTEFFTWLTDNVPYYAVPRYVEQLDALPKNPVNRILKTVLREAGITATTWDFRTLGLTINKENRR